MAEKKNWFMVCYDIRDPKRWRKAYKLLEGYGERIQYSIFRCRLNAREVEKLRWELAKILEQEEDSLLLVGLCNRCVERITMKNRPEAWPVEEDPFLIR
jgi:CRISPR-associated protein Cas2